LVAVDCITISNAVSSHLPGFEANKASDHNPATAWSSEVTASPESHEWVAFWLLGGAQPVNYVKITPRLAGKKPVGLPVHFEITAIPQEFKKKWLEV